MGLLVLLGFYGILFFGQVVDSSFLFRCLCAKVLSSLKDVQSITDCFYMYERIIDSFLVSILENALKLDSLNNLCNSLDNILW